METCSPWIEMKLQSLPPPPTARPATAIKSFRETHHPRVPGRESPAPPLSSLWPPWLRLTPSRCVALAEAVICPSELWLKVLNAEENCRRAPEHVLGGIRMTALQVSYAVARDSLPFHSPTSLLASPPLLHCFDIPFSNQTHGGACAAARGALAADCWL